MDVTSPSDENQRLAMAAPTGMAMMVRTPRRLRTLAAAALLPVLPVLACAAAPSPSSSEPPSTPSSGSSAALPPVRDLASTHATTIKAAPQPDWAIAAGGSVWVAGVGPCLQRYDAATAAATSAQNLDSVCLAMDQGFGSVWVGSCSFDKPMLVRLDATTGAPLARIPLPAPPAAESSIAAGEEAVRFLTYDGTQIVTADPATNTVNHTYPAPSGAAALRAGDGAVWVSVSPSGAGKPGGLVRLNPSTGAVVATIPLGHSPHFLAIAPGAVWVMNQSDGTVSRVDPATNQVTATITVSSEAITGGDIAATADAVWVRVSDALAVHIDPHTNTVIDRLGPRAGSGGVAIATTSVWFTAHDRQAIWRLPRS
jgi:YVTN family beta-propeller protein